MKSTKQKGQTFNDSILLSQSRVLARVTKKNVVESRRFFRYYQAALETPEVAEAIARKVDELFSADGEPTNCSEIGF